MLKTLSSFPEGKVFIHLHIPFPSQSAWYMHICAFYFYMQSNNKFVYEHELFNVITVLYVGNRVTLFIITTR